MANDISPCYHARVYLLPNLVRHNAWANRAVLDAFATAPAVLNTICYDGAPLFARLQHQAGTERAFLDILRVTPKRPEPPSELAAVTSTRPKRALDSSPSLSSWATPRKNDSSLSPGGSLNCRCMCS